MIAAEGEREGHSLLGMWLSGRLLMLQAIASRPCSYMGGTDWTRVAFDSNELGVTVSKQGDDNSLCCFGDHRDLLRLIF